MGIDSNLKFLKLTTWVMFIQWSTAKEEQMYTNKPVSVLLQIGYKL